MRNYTRPDTRERVNHIKRIQEIWKASQTRNLIKKVKNRASLKIHAIT